MWHSATTQLQQADKQFLDHFHHKLALTLLVLYKKTLYTYQQFTTDYSTGTMRLIEHTETVDGEVVQHVGLAHDMHRDQ